MYFECEKVDLTAEIKISENVLSLFGALYFVNKFGSLSLERVWRFIGCMEMVQSTL